MKRNERMLRIDQARQKLFDAIIEGVGMGSDSNSEKLQKIRQNLQNAIDTACFLDMDETSRTKVAEQFLKALKSDKHHYLNEYGALCRRFVENTQHDPDAPEMDNVDAVVRYYFEHVEGDVEVTRWANWFAGKSDLDEGL